MKRSIATLVAVLALGAQAGATARSVTLVGITGAGGDRFTDQLEEGLGDLYQVVPGEVYQRTFERLEKSGASAEELQAVAARLRIDAVIGGSLAGDGKSRQLLVTVRAGASGRVIARGHYDLAGRPVAAVCQRVLADLVRALDHVTPAAAPPPKPRAPETVTVAHHEDEGDDDSAPPRPAPAQVRKAPRVPVAAALRKESDDDDDDSAPPRPAPVQARKVRAPAPVVQESDDDDDSAPVAAPAPKMARPAARPSAPPPPPVDED